MSALLAKQRLGVRLHAVCARFAGMVRQTVTANPELFLPVFLLFVWQIMAIAVKPQTLGLAVLMTLLLLVYAYRVLGKTPWLRRLGWVSPRQGFWLYSVLAGLASSAGQENSMRRRNTTQGFVKRSGDRPDASAGRKAGKNAIEPEPLTRGHPA